MTECHHSGRFVHDWWVRNAHDRLQIPVIARYKSIGKGDDVREPHARRRNQWSSSYRMPLLMCLECKVECYTKAVMLCTWGIKLFYTPKHEQCSDTLRME